MKNAFLSLLTLCLGSVTFAQQSINFEKNSSLKAVLSKAKKENKLVFVDAYATWCGPCKMLDRNTFTDPAVKAYFDREFVNAKMDMEKGEGPETAKKYQVYSYPTMLFLDSEGKIVQRLVGYVEPSRLMGEAQKLKGRTQGLDVRKAEFKKGKKDLGFLMGLMDDFQTSDAAFYRQVAEVYFKEKKGAPNREEFLHLIRNIRSSGDILYPYFKQYKTEILTYVPSQDYYNLDLQFRLGDIPSRTLATGFSPDSEAKFLTEATQAVGPQGAKEYLAKVKMQHYASQKDFANFEKTATAYYLSQELPPMEEVTSVASTYLQMSQDPVVLAQAAKIVQKNPAWQNSTEALMLLAKLYKQAGQPKEVQEMIRRGMQLSSDNPELKKAFETLK